jgi:hypothetical protein
MSPFQSSNDSRGRFPLESHGSPSLSGSGTDRGCFTKRCPRIGRPPALRLRRMEKPAAADAPHGSFSVDWTAGFDARGRRTARDGIRPGFIANSHRASKHGETTPGRVELYPARMAPFQAMASGASASSRNWTGSALQLVKVEMLHRIEHPGVAPRAAERVADRED